MLVQHTRELFLMAYKGLICNIISLNSNQNYSRETENPSKAFSKIMSYIIFSKPENNVFKNLNLNKKR